MKISKELRNKLLKSKYVKKVSTSHISYTDSFKRKSLKLYDEGYSPNEIFKQLGFEPADFVSGYFVGCLDRWLAILEKHKDFRGERRGRPVGKKHDPKDLDQFSKEELKVIIEIQEELLKASKK